jgi:hypothetical protein
MTAGVFLFPRDDQSRVKIFNNVLDYIFSQEIHAMTIRNGRARGIALSALAFFLPLLLWSQPKTIQTEQLIRESDVIVVGSVGALKSEWNADRSRIQTLVTLNVSETVKGSAQGGSLTVVIPGGEIDGVGEWYSHSVRFQDTEEVVVFAKKDAAGVMRVTGGEHGKFLVKEGNKGGSKVIPNVGSLADFTAQVKKTVKAQQSSTNGQ